MYLKLDILPDVHIAEEARESGSIAIFDLIRGKAIMYSVINDYVRSIDSDNPVQATLNGDTAARSMLDI